MSAGRGSSDLLVEMEIAAQLQPCSNLIVFSLAFRKLQRPLLAVQRRSDLALETHGVMMSPNSAHCFPSKRCNCICSMGEWS